MAKQTVTGQLRSQEHYAGLFIAMNRSWLVAGYCVLMGILLFSRAMIGFENHDEDHMVAAGVLAVDGLIYSDFMLEQPPNHALFLSIIYSFFDSHYLLIARISTWFFSFGSFILLYFCARNFVENRFLALWAPTMFLFSPIVERAIWTARNDAMACFFSILALWAYFKAQQRTSHAALFYMLCGFAIALAVGTKTTYFLFPVILMSFAFFRDDGRPLKARTVSVLLPIVGGGILGSVHLLYLMASNLEAFLFGNFVYYRVTPYEWYLINGEEHLVSFLSNVRWLLSWLSRGATLGGQIAVGIFLALMIARNDRKQTFDKVIENEGLLLFSLLACGVVVTFIPNLFLSHYLTSIMPVLFLLPIVFCAAIDWIPLKQKIAILAAIAMVSLPLPLAKTLLTLGSLPDSERWSGMIVHNTGQNIASALDSSGVCGKIASLSPGRALESGYPVYRELSTGPFIYRAGYIWSEELAGRLNFAIPSTLPKILDRDPPAGVFVGFERAGMPATGNWRIDLDADLIDYALSRGYREASGEFGGGQLFINEERGCLEP